jgi:hypothetical protein
LNGENGTMITPSDHHWHQLHHGYHRIANGSPFTIISNVSPLSVVVPLSPLDRQWTAIVAIGDGVDPDHWRQWIALGAILLPLVRMVPIVRTPIL